MLKNAYFSAYCSREAVELGFNPEELPSFREISLVIDQEGANNEFGNSYYIMKQAKLVKNALSNDIITICEKDGDIYVRISENYRFSPISIVPVRHA